MGKFGFFISFEGIEGSGKTTLARELTDILRSKGYDVVLTREPGGPVTGELLRDIILKKKIEFDPWAELFVMLAARRENVVKIIYPALREGKIVVADRFSDSSIAYQGYGRGLPRKIISRFNKFATMSLKPNLTFLVDLPVEEGLKRIGCKEGDRFEQEVVDFHKRVREGYLEIAKKAKKRIWVVDGTKKKEEIIREVEEVAVERIEEKKKR